ncbi:MAG: hypothetical protein LBE86_07395 [Gemmobacter sp.]|jgi:hypothetical protein|nr:hypothetical protein [Gemmobacter sp.]
MGPAATAAGERQSKGEDLRLQITTVLAMPAVSGCVQPGADRQAQADAATRQAEAATGVSADNIVAYSANGAGMGGFVLSGVPNILFYKAASTDKSQLKAAPARICAGRGVASAEDKALEHSDQLPGVRKLVVKCK